MKGFIQLKTYLGLFSLLYFYFYFGLLNISLLEIEN